MKSLYLKNLKLFRCVHNWNIVKCSSITTFARYISKHTGLNLTDIVHLDYVYDTLLCESVHNKSLPKWTEKVFPASNPGTWPTQFKALRDLSFTVDAFTDPMKRLKGGPFLQLLVDHYTNLQQGE